MNLSSVGVVNFISTVCIIWLRLEKVSATKYLFIKSFQKAINTHKTETKTKSSGAESLDLVKTSRRKFLNLSTDCFTGLRGNKGLTAAQEFILTQTLWKHTSRSGLRARICTNNNTLTTAAWFWSKPENSLTRTVGPGFSNMQEEVDQRLNWEFTCFGTNKRNLSSGRTTLCLCGSELCVCVYVCSCNKIV